MKRYTRNIAVFGAVSMIIVLATGRLSAGGEGNDGLNKPRFAFALWGDTPYSVDQIAKIAALTADINASQVEFTVFDGDIKSGSIWCTDNVYSDAIDRFNAFEAPLIYVPGDNEWTDCHRINNGGYNNLERLAHLRRTMFASPDSFGQRTLPLVHQGPLGGEYAENTRWSYGPVVFVGLNVPGSNNNKVNGPDCTKKSVRMAPECRADNEEYAARDAANISFLKESFEEAKVNNALGLVVIMQADPSFDLPETEDVNERACGRLPQGQCQAGTVNPALDGYDGYTAFLSELASETSNFSGQVVLVHGDTHYFKVDQPLVDATHLLPNFTRVQTYGSPNINWIRVTVDPKTRALFTFEPMLVPAP